jgi:hypothetical protein
MRSKAGFIIDKITESIEEVTTGKSFETETLLVSIDEINKVHKKDGWLFNWKKEFKEPGRQLYKLVIAGDKEIQGIISIEPVTDQLYIEMHLIENAPHNFGTNKKFVGVAANLVAFACKMSFDLGFEGFVAFNAKTELTDHYAETLGAQSIYSPERMAIFTAAAKNLVNSYYKNYFGG